MNNSTTNPFLGQTSSSPIYFLETLWMGMDHIAAELRSIETKKLAQEKIRCPGLLATSSSYDAEDRFIANYFIWYANSAVNFLDLFHVTFRPSIYYMAEFSALCKWRNKVAAHTAYAKPKGENTVTKNYSLSALLPEYMGDRYGVASWVLQDASGSTPDDWSWYLTTEHERIFKYVIGAL
ncbi:MAG TPA: hypothetical protein VIS74_08100 [Chthoniobacterales bacterium]